MPRLLTAAVMLLVSSVAVAQEADAQADKAQTVLQRMADHFAKAQQFSVDVAIDVDINMHGQQENSTASLSAAVKKPDKFRLSFTSQDTTGVTINDGEQTTTYIKSFNQYQTQPTNPVAPLDHQMMGMLLNGALTAEDPYAALTEGARSMAYRDTAKVGKATCDVVRLVTDEGLIDIYVQQGDDPVPLKAVVDQTPALRAAGQSGSVEVVITYNNWTVGQELGADLFTFEAPEDARKVAQFSPPQPSDALLGQPAPAVNLQTLDGEKFTLDDAQGKIVVLDFWATWCAPCVKAMPIIKQVTSDMADQDVVFYTVNQREGANKVKAFLNKHDMADLNVLMDTDAAVAQAYMVRGIPQTVIIGKDGTVQAVHVGFSPQIGETLKQELQTLADGGKLAN